LDARLEPRESAFPGWSLGTRNSSPMQQVVFEKPYRFIPPHRGDWWPSFIQLFHLNDFYLRRYHGVARCEIRHVERLTASFAAGHSVMLTPNHCRPADPIVLGYLAR